MCISEDQRTEQQENIIDLDLVASSGNNNIVICLIAPKTSVKGIWGESYHLLEAHNYQTVQ